MNDNKKGNKMEELYTFFKEGTYLNLFFREKEINADSITFTDSTGVFNYMPLSVVCECISNSSEKDVAAIESKLREIDFVNGDVVHFLEYLGKEIREQQIKSYIN